MNLGDIQITRPLGIHETHRVYLVRLLRLFLVYLASAVGISLSLLFLRAFLNLVRPLNWSIASATLLLLMGLGLGQLFALWTRFSEHASEYVWRSLLELWKPVACILLVEGLAGTALLYLTVAVIPSLQIAAPFLAVMYGFPSALLLVGYERYLAANEYERYLTAKRTVSEVERSIKREKFKWGLLQTVESRIQHYMEQDNFAWQNAEGQWYFGVPPEEIGRRLRKLYEFYKLPIAIKYRKPWLLKYDVDTHPGQKFYLLVKFLGRKKLMRLLESAVEVPSQSWDGRERRRRPGSINDRKNNSPEDKNRKRSYDDESLMERIKQGKVGD